MVQQRLQSLNMLCVEQVHHPIMQHPHHRSL
jgi:hypothetical protein